MKRVFTRFPFSVRPRSCLQASGKFSSHKSFTWMAPTAQMCSLPSPVNQHKITIIVLALCRASFQCQNKISSCLRANICHSKHSVTQDSKQFSSLPLYILFCIKAIGDNNRQKQKLVRGLFRLPDGYGRIISRDGDNARLKEMLISRRTYEERENSSLSPLIRLSSNRIFAARAIRNLKKPFGVYL